MGTGGSLRKRRAQPNECTRTKTSALQQGTCARRVGAGPVVADAIFHNREEVAVQPLFYDPVHDFGFMRFDPAKLQYMQARVLRL